MLRCVIFSGCVLSLSACDGKASIETSGDVDLEPFRSATWVHSDPIPFYLFADGALSEQGEVQLDPLSAVSYRRTCREQKADMEKWAELSTMVVEASTPEAACEAMIGLAAWQDYEAADLPTVRSALYVRLDALTDGEHPASNQLITDGVAASLVTVDHTGCEPRLSWDDEACAPLPSDCGTTHTYDVEDAALNVGAAEVNVSAELTGNLSEDGVDAGAFDVSFTADDCDLGGVGPLVVY